MCVVVDMYAIKYIGPICYFRPDIGASFRIFVKLNVKLEYLFEYVLFSVFTAAGDLTSFSQVDDHHVTLHGFDCGLFTQENRPACIKDQFAEAEVSPSRILRGADRYRKDGLCSSRLFRLWPVALREPKVKTPDLNLPRKVMCINVVIYLTLYTYIVLGRILWTNS